jgi:apolipoprotein N-acyltransferase
MGSSLNSSNAGSKRAWQPQDSIAGLASVILLTLAAAPWYQWYLVWIGLAPWLVAVGRAPTLKAAVWFGCWTGWLYFALNIWWLWTASIPGTILIVVYFGLYWGLAAGLIFYFRLSRSDASAGSPPIVVQVMGTAVVWVAIEWLRLQLSLGFPWLPIGATQSPLVVMCQVADLGGVWVVNFWLVLVNAWAAACWRNRREWRLLWPASFTVAVVLAYVAGYGAWRLETTPRLAGPRVMVIQSNHPILRGGESTTTPQRAAEFFVAQLAERLTTERADLVILPENEFPPLNDEARARLAPSSVGPFLERTHQQLVTMARENQTAIVVGGAAVAGWTTKGKEHVGSEIYNSAYFYDRSSEPAVYRYDKIRLVAFSERMPFSAGPAWLRRIGLWLAASRAVQPLQSGTMAKFAPFELVWSRSEPNGEAAATRKQTRFVTPICLENIESRVVADMLWDSSADRKRADFIANLSNDGWFHAQEKHQHFQLLAFRCIENRVPLARSSNTGISGFIDSTGRVREMLPVNAAGAATDALELDDRETFYARHGDVFAWFCVLAVGAGIVFRAARNA